MTAVAALRMKLEFDVNDEGFTLREYMTKFGLTQGQADHELRWMIFCGELIKGVSRRTDDRGIKRRVNVYRAAK